MRNYEQKSEDGAFSQLEDDGYVFKKLLGHIIAAGEAGVSKYMQEGGKDMREKVGVVWSKGRMYEGDGQDCFGQFEKKNFKLLI